MNRGQLILGVTALSLTGCKVFPLKKEVKKEEPKRVFIQKPIDLNKDWRSSDTDFWNVKNERVAKWTRYYEKNRDPWKLWNKAEPFLPYLKRQMEIHKLPNEFCLLPMIESSFDPSARSKNAAGMWQFIKTTGLDMGLVINPFVDERLNWQKSTVAACKYLSRLAHKFDGDWALVLAAYNMGPGAVMGAVAKQDNNDYWSLNIREETAEYVPKLLAMIQLLRRSYPDPRT